VGSRFIPRLVEAGDDVRALVRAHGRAQQLRAAGAEVVVGDLRDDGSVRRALEGIDRVVHLGASFRGGVPEEEAYAVNQLGTEVLGRAAVRAGVERFVFASTSLAYGPGRGRPAREDDEPDPTSAYPRSKVAAERALATMEASGGLGLRVIRLAFVYGEQDDHLAEAPRWATGWPAHKRLHLLHHADAAAALLSALNTDGLDGRTFNAADDTPLTAVELLTLNGAAVPPEAATRELTDPWEGILDTTRMRAELGVRLRFPSVYSARDAGAL